MQNILKFNAKWFQTLGRISKIWLGREALANRFVAILIGFGVVCGFLTYGALTNVPPFGNSSRALIVMLNIDLIILLTLVVFVCRRMITLYIRRKKGIVGSNLHIRLVFTFSLLAALPAIIMAIFSVGFFYFGLHGWLDDRVRSAIHESEEVALAYLSEHQQLIRADVLAMASDLDRQAEFLTEKPEAMKKMIATQSYLRNFSDVYLFNSIGVIKGQTENSPHFNHNDIPFDKLQAAKDEVVILTGKSDSIQALLKLRNYDDIFLYTQRSVDPKVLGHIERTRKGVAQYNDIQTRSTRLQILLTMIYLVVTLLLTVAAVWFGLSFARKLVAPIAMLIHASEQVKEGNLSARVETRDALDEFKLLGRAFNTMTEQIQNQQVELIGANAKVDFRRRFTETILGGVSTGILSLDEEGRVTLANNASGDLLMTDIEHLLGQKIAYLMPDIMPHLEESYEQDKYGAVKTCEITVRRKDSSVRTFMVRIVIERMDDSQKGAILTFDDLTTVLATQKKAAWADVARRIAHEIKNPLTPIQLSAERLNRKYRKNLAEKDQMVFDQCTETIIRHVNDIKTMVNAFADFAKMPDPVIESAALLPVVRDIFALNKNAFKGIDFSMMTQESLSENMMVEFDEQQIRQVLTNLIKNAVEAMDHQDDEKVVQVYCFTDDHYFYVGINDSGAGLPDENIELLVEPYVTHKPKGTGLGLAIVKKIIEDHDGQLLFTAPLPIIEAKINNFKTLKGAFVTIALPYKDDNADDR